MMILPFEMMMFVTDSGVFDSTKPSVRFYIKMKILQ